MIKIEEATTHYAVDIARLIKQDRLTYMFTVSIDMSYFVFITHHF